MNIDNELVQLDRELLEGYVQSIGQDVVSQMFALYVQQVQVYLNDIENTLLNDDAKLWQEHCHKMKGSAASAGLSQVHQKLVVIEKSTEDWPVKAAHLRVLTELNQQAIDVFQQWLSDQ